MCPKSSTLIVKFFEPKTNMLVSFFVKHGNSYVLFSKEQRTELFA